MSHLNCQVETQRMNLPEFYPAREDSPHWTKDTRGSYMSIQNTRLRATISGQRSSKYRDDGEEANLRNISADVILNVK